MRAVNKSILGGVTAENIEDRLWGAEFPAKTSLLNRCLTYSLCPMALVSEQNLQLFSLYNQLGGTSRIATIDQIAEQPEKYLQACGIIETERYRLAKIRQEESKDYR